MPLGKYGLDFACESRRLAVEVDGSQHFESVDDQQRAAWLKSKGWKIVRFWNNGFCRTPMLFCKRF